MECKECKIVCNGKDIATIDCNKDGITIKCTKEGKDICGEMTKGCCK
ncbi:MAG: hypothetical protein ABH950_08075 [Candidatus Altiarchaeota archaeon]